MTRPISVVSFKSSKVALNDTDNKADKALAGNKARHKREYENG
jgi:hypothetical protein